MTLGPEVYRPAIATDPVYKQVEIDVESTEEFQELDRLISEHDADAEAPIRQGAEPFQWEKVYLAAERLADRVADLRVGVWLFRAAMSTRSLSGVADVLKRIETWSELPCEALSPIGDTDLPAHELHVLILEWLESPSCIYSLGQAALSPDHQIASSEFFKNPGAFDVGESARHQILQDIHRAYQSAVAIEEAFARRQLTPTLSLSATKRYFQQGIQVLAPSGGGVEETQPAASLHGQTSLAGSGKLSSREEARAMLSELIDYFSTYEPGHPAPLFLVRVQRMLGASFEDLMRELYQDAPQLVAMLEKPASH
jgi:type VI secretion system protein ImpA